MECIKILTAHLERSLQILQNPVAPVLIAVKKDPQSVEQNHSTYTTDQNPDIDRKFPVDGQSLEEFNLNTGSDVEHATIHTGSYADGLARSLHSLALVIGTDIYFRSNAYKPETEEGRKTIAHELTHVAQHKSRPLADNRTKDELESEAEAAEKTAESVQSRKIKVTVCGQDYYMSEKQHRQFMGMLKEAVEDELDWMKYTEKPEEYDKIMKAYRRMEHRGELPWQIQANKARTV